MSKPLVLCSYLDRSAGRWNGVTDFFVNIFEKRFKIIWMDDFEQDVAKYAKDVVAIASFIKRPPVTEELIKKLPNLKIVANIGVGYNHLDVPMIRSFGVKVSNTPLVLDDATSDLGMALLLNAGRQLHSNITLLRSPETTQIDTNYMTNDVSGTTIGILGMGRIGYKVAQRAKAFNMKILYHNRSRRDEGEEANIGAQYYSNLNEMLPHCDYVMVTLPLTAETQKIMGSAQFKLMKSTAILVNISRGGTVDQDALVHALTHGEIQFAALDVTEPEPLPRDHKLLSLENVIITPHMGSGTLNTRIAMAQKAFDNVVAAVDGTALPSEVFK
uniref:Glyoxylate reductase/hydroxypyruvate reductase n=1 Tax=Ciona intestinalis TaxID=7719 RepID=F6S8Y1_CIOIN|nr:uncharacterized protein LOC100184381 [Ciona intestinalis]|eukprot:XP_002131147.1 uncharacterized protein LOC100184381 [Ciona intestinalis]